MAVESINCCKELCRPFHFYHRGKKYPVEDQVVISVMAIAAAILTLPLLGIGGVALLYFLTTRYKIRQLKELQAERPPTPISIRGMKRDFSAYLDFDCKRLDSKNLSEKDIKDVLYFAAAKVQEEQKKNFPNATYHLQILINVINMHEKRDELIQFIKQHPISAFPRSSHPNGGIVNRYLWKEVGILFHYEENDVSYLIKQCPLLYVEHFLEARQCNKLHMFIQQVFTPWNYPCMEKNFETLSHWVENQVFSILPPDVKPSIQNVVQLLSKYYLAFQEIKLREFLKEHPEKIAESRLELLSQLNYKKVDFLAYLKDKENNFFPITSVDRVTLDYDNIESYVNKLDEEQDLFTEENP